MKIEEKCETEQTRVHKVDIKFAWIVEFTLAGNERLHFPRRNKTDELLSITAVASLTRIAGSKEMDERTFRTLIKFNPTSAIIFLLPPSTICVFFVQPKIFTFKKCGKIQGYFLMFFLEKKNSITFNSITLSNNFCLNIKMFIW